MADITIQNFNGDQDIQVSAAQSGQGSTSSNGVATNGNFSNGAASSGTSSNGTASAIASPVSGGNSTGGGPASSGNTSSSAGTSSANTSSGSSQNMGTQNNANQQGANQTSQNKNQQGNINLEDEALLMSQQTIAPPEKYNVPALVKEKFPDLIQLIKETESMSEAERDYWFQVLPIMTEDQIQKFRTILVNEKEQLARLDREYEDHIEKLNEKHMIEWKEFESKQKREAIATAEAKTEQDEAETEEALLQRLSQV